MLSEQELINGEVKASDDTEGVDTLIQSLYNEIMKKRFRVAQYHREKKSEAAIELEETANEMQKEMDSIIKSQMSYMKYLKAIGQGGNGKRAGVSQQVKDQKSSLGAIVSLIPKS
jgi:hypothetical protein